MRSLPTDAVQTAALLGDLPDVDRHDLFAEKLLRRSFSLGILLNAKHRQGNHPFRLQIVQVAADGADPTGRDKGEVHCVQAAVLHRSLHLLLKAAG